MDAAKKILQAFNCCFYYIVSHNLIENFKNEISEIEPAFIEDVDLVIKLNTFVHKKLIESGFVEEKDDT